MNKKLRELRELRELILNHKTVSCEICKCLIYKYDAIKGKSIIKNKVWDIYFNVYGAKKAEEYIHTPYYCHRCKPTTKKK